MWWLALALGAGTYGELVNDPAEVRFCVAAAEVQAGAPGGSPDDGYFHDLVARKFLLRLADLGAMDKAALAAAKAAYSGSAEEEVRYEHCRTLALSIPEGGDLVAAAAIADGEADGALAAAVAAADAAADAAEAAAAMDGSAADAAEAAPMADGAAALAAPDTPSCFAMLASFRRGMTTGSREAKAFDAMMARLEMRHYAEKGETPDAAADLVGAVVAFDAEAFEALSEEEAEPRMQACMDLANA